METYSKFKPTSLDPTGYILDDRQEWLVVPVSQTRDSGELDQSNFATALKMLGGEGETVEVHRFMHWGPGWFEIIIVDPKDADKVKIAEDIETGLADYPVLNEEDFSQRESEAAWEAWENWGFSEAIDLLCKKYDGELRELFEDISTEDLWQVFINNSNAPYFQDSGGVCLSIDVEDFPPDELWELVDKTELAENLRRHSFSWNLMHGDLFAPEMSWYWQGKTPDYSLLIVV